MAQTQISLHARTAQVKVTPRKTQVFTGVATVLNGERRSFGSIEKLPFVGHNLNLAGHHVGVDHTVRTGAHLALDRKHIFRTQNMDIFVCRRGNIGAEHNLGQPVAVAQVDKNEAAVVAAVLHPTHQANIFTIIIDGQLAA